MAAAQKLSSSMESALADAVDCHGILVCSDRTKEALVKRGFVARHQNSEDALPFYTLTDEGWRVGRDVLYRTLGMTSGKAGDQ